MTAAPIRRLFVRSGEVARKLAVLLHRLWVTVEEHEPLRNAKLQEEELAAVAKR